MMSRKYLHGVIHKRDNRQERSRLPVGRPNCARCYLDYEVWRTTPMMRQPRSCRRWAEWTRRQR